MNNPEEKQKPETTPQDKLSGWIVLICGILTNVVLYNGTNIYLSSHNAGMPPALIFLLLLFVWGFGLEAISHRRYVLAILGIIFSLPSTVVFLWFVCCYVIPFYVQKVIGGG